MPSIATIHYAQPPPDYFWSWSSDYSATEWQSGQTIGLWMELHPLLRFLDEEGGLPPLGAVILLLAACRDDWPTKALVLGDWMKAADGGPDGDALVSALYAALRSVHRLPADLRSSMQAKCLLASAVFESRVTRLPQVPSHNIIDELRISGPAQLKSTEPDLNGKARFLRDAKALLTGLSAHDERTLESRLRTSLDQPELFGAALPAEDPPREEGRPLLDELSSLGGEFATVAALAKRAIAMMNFPGRFGSPDNLPVGGISDITNRGTIDRLLPGELAWDDLVLAARLVHNEALYFRREVPPADVPVRHVVLLDRGLRLWGHRRVLSLGIALGLAHHPSFRNDGGDIDILAATTDGTEALDLLSVAGVQSVLEKLVPSPGPLVALEDYRDECGTFTTPEDVVYITAHEHLDAPKCRVLLGEIAATVEERAGTFRVITLERGGALEIQAWSTGGNRTIFRGVLEEKDVLPVQAATAPPLRSQWQELPARSPFLFPIIPSSLSFLQDPATGGGIGISGRNRVMRWPKEGWGGQELRDEVPGSKHWFGHDERGDVIFIAAAETAGESVRVFRLAGDSLEEIAIQRSAHSYPRHAAVNGGAVILAYLNKVEAFSLESGHRLASHPIATLPDRPILTFNGETIAVHKTPAEIKSPSEGWRYNDPSWPRMIVPKSISVTDGILRIKCESIVYAYNSEKVSWSVEKGRAAGPFLPFEQTDLYPERPGVCVARFGQTIALYDPIGVLELGNPAGADGWSLLVTNSTASAWNSQFGLFSFEPRLRLPADGAPGPFPYDLIRRYISHMWENLRHK